MPSYCVHYLTDVEHERPGDIVGSIFIHDQSLAEAERNARARSAAFADASAFIILGMGGNVHMRKVLGVADDGLSRRTRSG